MNKFRNKKDKFELNFYFKNQLIKKIKVDNDEKPFEKYYVISVRHQKHLFGTNKKVTIVAKPVLLKYTDNPNKKVHIEIEPFDGVDVYE